MHQTTLFVVATYALTLLGWAPLLLGCTAFDTRPGAISFAAGGLAPLVVSILLSCKDGRPPWPRAWMPPKAPIAVWVTLVVTPTLATAATAAVLITRDATGLCSRSEDLLSDLPGSLAMVVTTLLVGPLPEELAWRGYALGPLERTLGRVRATLLLGTAWLLWHLPLFFIPGSPFATTYALPSGPFFVWCAAVVAMALYIGAVRAWSRDSTLIAVLAHFGLNMSGALLALDRSDMPVLLAMICLTAPPAGWVLWRAPPPNPQHNGPRTPAPSPGACTAPTTGVQ